MPDTMTLISSYTVSSPGNSVTFSSIPQTYTDLKLVFATRSDYGSGGSEVEVAINSLTTGYSSKMVYSDGSNVASANASNAFFTWGGGMVAGGATANTFGSSEMYFANYSGSQIKTSVTDSVTENNSSAVFNQLVSHINTTTSPITSITLTAWQNFINFVAGSTFYLYGIKNS